MKTIVIITIIIGVVFTVMAINEFKWIAFTSNTGIVEILENIDSELSRIAIMMFGTSDHSEQSRIAIMIRESVIRNAWMFTFVAIGCFIGGSVMIVKKK